MSKRKRSHKKQERQNPAEKHLEDADADAGFTIEASGSTARDRGKDIMTLLTAGKETEEAAALAREKAAKDGLDPDERGWAEEMDEVAGDGFTFVEVANEEPEVAQKDTPKAKKPRKDVSGCDFFVFQDR